MAADAVNFAVKNDLSPNLSRICIQPIIKDQVGNLGATLFRDEHIRKPNALYCMVYQEGRGVKKTRNFKMIISAVLAIIAVGSTTSAFAQLAVWEDTFTTGVATTNDQANTWLDFRASLSGLTAESVTMSGSLDPTGITCSDPAAVADIAALLAGSSNGLVACDGHTWNLCATRYSGELWIDAPAVCSGSNCPDPGYIIRPGIGNQNWGGAGTATCDGPTQTLRLEFGGTSQNARFRVTKTFSDGNDAEVDVMLTCNSGNPLEQSFTIEGGGDGVLFVVENISAEGATCTVTETDGPDGYTPVFNGGDGCSWEDVTTGYYSCEITNEADPAEFTVTKEWVIEGAVLEEVIQEAQVTINCSSDILTIDGNEVIEPDGSVSANLSGDGDSVTVTVDTSLGSTSCSAYESTYQTGVESEDDCGSRSIAAGGSSSCTITNTVFFEGIPTLSQYGMALMALLMLGLGFVGLRRFF